MQEMKEKRGKRMQEIIHAETNANKQTQSQRRSNIKFRTIENSHVKTTKQFSKKQNV